MRFKAFLPFLIAIAVCLPGIILRILGIRLDPATMALTCGVAIVGASFLLLWACDAIGADVSAALALGMVALVAVLPEYAVDMYFTWQAGKNPDSNYAHYAIANMTGANRLLIGLGWGVIALVFWIKHRKAVQLTADRRTELLFLGLATVYAFVIPIKGSLTWYDGLVFLGIYVAYIAVSARRPPEQLEAGGPADLLLALPARRRRTMVLGLFLLAAGTILANAAPFCEGLVGAGRELHINEFLLIQWLAPIASEAPEFTLAIIFAWRGQAGMALGSLLSSKLNQWTLLVGMIPGVFAVSHGTLAHPLPLDCYQMREILLTAAQSLLAVIMLASLRLSVRGALLLFVLFMGQLLVPEFVRTHCGSSQGTEADHMRDLCRDLFTLLYFLTSGVFMWRNYRFVYDLRLGLVTDRQ